jgi:hypothetical protein
MQRARSKLFDDGAVLLVQAKLERLFAIGVQREKIEIVVGAPVQHAPLKVDGGVNKGVGGAAVFRLNVEGGLAHFDVCIVTKKHLAVRPCLRSCSKPLCRTFPAAFDRPAVESLL